jgi:hypothetical protein
VKRLWNGQPRNCGWITNRSNGFFLLSKFPVQFWGPPTRYSVDSHKSFSEDKVVGASSWPLISILYTTLQTLKLCPNLPALLPVQHTHISTRKIKNARGEPARNICHGVSLHLELYKCLHFLCRLPAQVSKQSQPMRVCLQITLQEFAQFVLLTTQYIPSPKLPTSTPQNVYESRPQTSDLQQTILTGNFVVCLTVVCYK